MPLELCPFCERLYSNHSIRIHLPKCLENPNNQRRIASRSPSRKRKKEESRPTTRSLSRNSHTSQRICYICGKGFLEEDLSDHEQQCLRIWQQTADHLSPIFITKEPRRLWHPSVDGTRDITRQNSMAREQSRIAQKVRCRNCRAAVGFWQAIDHVCHRAEIEFFISQRS